MALPRVELTTSTVSSIICHAVAVPSGLQTCIYNIGCSDGDVRLLEGDVHRLDDGDVEGLFNVCEDQQWRYIVLCEAEWTSANSRVACRQLGHAAAGRLLADQISLAHQTLLHFLQQVLYFMVIK